MIFHHNKYNNKNHILLLVILLLILFSFPMSYDLFIDTNLGMRIGNKPVSELKYLKIAANSERISISNWTEAVDSGICSGSGTFSDPYIIQDFIIDGNGTGTGISIGNSKNVFFRIENCTVFNCTYGIRLGISCNGTLVNNNCSFNENGIYLDSWIDIPHPTPEIVAQCYCMNNTVSNNTINFNEDFGIYCRGFAAGPPGELEDNVFKGNIINNNRWGIYFYAFCINNTVIDNYLINNEEVGMFLEGPCENNTIKGNKMESSGFYSDYYIFSINKIDDSNLVNNGPFYFYKDRDDLGEVDFSNAGQIYLVNCNNTNITGQDLSDSTLPISLIECNNIEISDNNLSSNYAFGMDLRNCSKISIFRNEINNNREGIEIHNVNNSIISENEINHNLLEGIYMSSFNNNTISKNSINSNGFRAGIRMFGYCSDNLISDNRFKDNYLEGLSLALYSTNNRIKENVFKSNQIGVYFDPSCVNNKFYLNFFIDNEENHVINSPITNTWNTTDIGNYWDNYTGFDNNDDGIGDSPHLIDYSSLIYDYLPIVDNLAPNITIYSPSSNINFASNPSFNIWVDEKYLDAMWYTLDGGLNNFTFTENGTIDQNAWNSLSYGLVNLKFYAIDKTGKVGFAEVNFNKQPQTIEEIPGFILPLLLMSVFILSLIIVRTSLSKILIRKR